MKFFAAVVAALVVWSSCFVASAGSGVKPHRRHERHLRHRLTHWQLRHRHRQRERLTVIRAAASLLGVSYVFGGSGRGGVDCSGLTRYAYAKIGRVLPHLAAAQERLGRFVRHPKPGDLLFYNHGGHAALYVGKGQMIEASSARGRVIRTSLREGWFVENFDQARRLIG